MFGGLRWDAGVIVDVWEVSAVVDVVAIKCARARSSWCVSVLELGKKKILVFVLGKDSRKFTFCSKSFQSNTRERKCLLLKFLTDGNLK